MTDEQSEPPPEQDSHNPDFEPLPFEPVPTPPSDPQTPTDEEDPPEDLADQLNRGIEDVGRIGVKYGKPLGAIKP